MIKFGNIDPLDLIMKADGGSDVQALRNEFARIRNARLFHSNWAHDEEGDHPSYPGQKISRFGSRANAQFSKLVKDHITATGQEPTPENFLAAAKGLPLTCQSCNGEKKISFGTKKFRCMRCAGKGFQNYDDNQRNMIYNNTVAVPKGTSLPYDHHESYDANFLKAAPLAAGQSIAWHPTEGAEKGWKVHPVAAKAEAPTTTPRVAPDGRKLTRSERKAANKAAYAEQKAKAAKEKAAVPAAPAASASIPAKAPKNKPQKAAPAPAPTPAAPMSALAQALAMKKSIFFSVEGLKKGINGVRMAEEETSTPEDRDPARGVKTLQNVAPKNTDPIMKDKVQVLGEEDPSFFDGDQPKRVVPKDNTMKIVKSEYDGIVPDENNMRSELQSDMRKSLNLGLSLDDRRQLVARALDERFPPKRDKKTGMLIGGYCYPQALFEDAVIVNPPPTKAGVVGPGPVKISYMIENGVAVLGKEETPVRQEWVEVGLKKGLLQGFGDLDALRKGNDIEAQDGANKWRAAKKIQSQGEKAFREDKTDAETPHDMMQRNNSADAARAKKKATAKLKKGEFYNKLATFLIDDATGAKRINIRREYVDRHPYPVPVLSLNLQKAMNGEVSLDEISVYSSDVVDAVKAVTGKDITTLNLKKSVVYDATDLHSPEEDPSNLMFVRKGLRAQM